MIQNVIDKLVVLQDKDLKQLLLSIDGKSDSDQLLNSLIEIRTISDGTRSPVIYGDRIYKCRVTKIKNQIIKEIVRRFIK